MNAPQLLATIEARGGKVAVALDGTGAAKIQISPRGLVPDLAGEIQRFKPALIELLTAPSAPKFRLVAGGKIALPANPKPAAPGAAKIAARLQSFERVFRAARGGELPTAPLAVEIRGELHTLENAAAACMAIEAEWTAAARNCQREARDLTAPEADALDAAAELLNHVWACFDGDGAVWLDLDALNRQLDADLKAMRKAQSEAAQ